MRKKCLSVLRDKCILYCVLSPHSDAERYISSHSYAITGQFGTILLVVMIMTRLKELRKERGLSQVQMQFLTGIDQSDYSKIETGRRNFSFEQCRRIALALNTSMDYLAGLTDEKKPYPRAADNRE